MAGLDGRSLALALSIAAMLGLRALGLLVAGRLRPDHPLIAWASAVSQATLSAFVALAVVLPGGAAASLPLAARLVGLAAGLLAWWWGGGRLLPALLAGLAALVAVRALLGG
ncbi:AzlD domain-containing protein [Roseicella frigidaeris]|uniref:AzlD domain-containing protein n=1 Tax=Roseicella frigidaeris TaxID=2230885 RepID=UPI000FDD62C9|nr:AzlD domain-containing protein [Roseicella frigidaeris]